LHITPELLISGTTGISRPLGDPHKVAAYLETGVASTRLRRRLESDVKALLAFYRYGILHGCVRLRWGFLDEGLPVEWTQPGEPHLHKILRRAAEAETPVELVVGTAPGWSEPWSRGRRARVRAVGSWDIACRFEDDSEPVDLWAVQAVRPVGERYIEEPGEMR
jgi:hypothetical protein